MKYYFRLLIESFLITECFCKLLRFIYAFFALLKLLEGSKRRFHSGSLALKCLQLPRLKGKSSFVDTF